MPRRGEHQRGFPPVPRAARLGRPDRSSRGSGAGPDRHDAGDRVSIPACFGARGWPGSWPTNGSTTSRSPASRAPRRRLGRRAIRDFCTQVDLRARRAGRRTQAWARQHPDLAARAGRVGTHPAHAVFARARPTPATLAATVRALISRRAQHDQRPVTAGLRRLVDGEVGVPWGSTQEIDEFSRADKRVLVRAAWEWAQPARRPPRRRMGGGRDGAGTPASTAGRNPQPAVGSCSRAGQPSAKSSTTYPSCITGRRSCGHASIAPTGRCRRDGQKKSWRDGWCSQLYPSHLDLHAYRVLLVAATGHAPEEVTALTIDDVEFLPSGVRLTLTKRRAQRVRHRTFGTAPAQTAAREPVDFTDRPHREVGAIIRRLIHVTDRGRRRAPDARAPVRGGVGDRRRRIAPRPMELQPSAVTLQ